MRNKERMGQMFELFEHVFVAFGRFRAQTILLKGLQQQLLLLTSKILGAILEINMAVLRGIVIGILFLLPFCVVAWIYCLVAAC